MKPNITTEELEAASATLKKLAELNAEIARQHERAEAMERELKLQSTHAQFARGVLRSIAAILTPDGGEEGVNALTGLEFRLERLPARVGELVNAGNDRDHLAGILEKIMQVFDGNPDEGPQDFSELPEWVGRIVRENETLARNMPSPPFTPEPGPQSLRDRIKDAINRVSAEKESDTPDFILADFMMASLDAFDAAVRTREEWYGRGTRAVDTDLPAPLGEQDVVEVIGQQWCRCDDPNDVPLDALRLKYVNDGWIVLCEVRRNVATGALTYTPLARKDLPDFRA